jgi:hypothetical protein
MPFIKEKFETYSEFANASLVDIYGDKLKTSYENSVTELRSMVLINKGDLVFEKHALPVAAQTFPILDAVVADVNHDGFEDIIAAGNIYETEVETPRLDALSGLILLSNGKDGYISVPYQNSGLFMNGNVKSIEWITTNQGTFLLNTTNNGPMGIHKISS